MALSGSYSARILLVEDDPAVAQGVCYMLRQNHYVVFEAKTPEEARKVLRHEIIHLTIIDVRLEHDLEGDKSGLTLLDDVPAGIAKIIYTGYPDEDTMKRALEARPGAHRAERFVSKKGSQAAKELLQSIRDVLMTHTPVNFRLCIDRSALAELVRDLTRVDDSNHTQLVEDSEEILRRLYYSDEVSAPLVTEIKFEPLFSPDAACSSSIVFRAIPTGDDGFIAPQLIKLSERSEIEAEQKGYQGFAPRLPTACRPQLQNQAYSRQFGGLCYQLLGASLAEDIVLFRHFYEQKSAERVARFLKKFLRASFEKTLAAKEEVTQFDLSAAYAEDLHLTPDKLSGALHELQPETDWSQPTFQLAGLNRRLINPYVWAVSDGAFRSFRLPKTYIAWCHGDLHSGNILTDGSDRGWLIDFARSKKSHVLRDFTELESDIKFALWSTATLEEALRFEEELLASARQDKPKPCSESMSDGWQKAYRAVTAIRKSARRLIGKDLDMREYYQALLFLTLNVVRLTSGDRAKFLQIRDRRYPVIAAALICERLAQWGDFQ